MISTKKKRVYFNLTPTIIYEPLDLVDELNNTEEIMKYKEKLIKKELKEFFLLFFLQNIEIKYM